MQTFLKKVSIGGFRSYDSNLDLNTIEFQDLNVIIGANGAGKSNLISFLEMISYMMTCGLRNYTAKHGGAQTLMYFGPKQTEQISGNLLIHDSEGEKEDVYSFALEQSATGQLFFSKEHMSYKDSAYRRPFEQDFGVGHFESRLPDSYNPTVRVLRNYLQELRVFHFNDTSISSRIRGASNVSDSNYLRSDGGNIAAFLYQIKQDNNYYKYYQRIIKYIRMIMPQFFDFVLIPDESGFVCLNWTQNGAEEVFGPHQFSDGTLRFIALTTLLMQPPKTAPLTIILDEPEIGLHPYAISVLAKEIRLASKVSQVIISTQSPMLLNEFSCTDVIVADYDQENRKSCLKRCSEEELHEWLTEYSLGELWEKNVLGGLPV